MKTLIKFTISTATFASLLAIIFPAQAATINVPINTGIAGKPGINIRDADSSFTWNYSGNYHDPRYQTYGFNDYFSWIMKDDIGSNNNYGADVPSNIRNFYGVAYLYNTFQLPQNGTDIKLDFSAIAADDRVILSLNDNELTRTALALPAYTSALGRMMDGNGSYTSTTFNGNGWEGNSNFTNPNLFNLGGTNILKFWVNNTDSTDPNADARPVKNLAWTNFRGNLSYNVPDPKPVPESSTTLGLLMLGVAGSLIIKNRKKSVVIS